MALLRGLRWLSFALSLGAAMPAVLAQGSTNPAAGAGTRVGIAIRALDGLTFAGMFGPEGGEERDQDTFIFSDGMFTSTGCIDYGFAPRPYWVRRAGDELHFLAEMVSEEHGTIVYTGSIRGDELNASYTWIKERWYWTIERKFWFTGKRVEKE